MNIVSLLPNATEIVDQLGYGQHLVGSSHECDHPEWVQDLPACTQTKILPEGSSREIDANVQNLVQQGLSVYEVNGDLLKKLEPDIIITQMQCELCAASPEDVENAVSQYLDYQPQVVTLAPNNLQDVWEDFHKIGRALGDEAKSQELEDRIKTQMAHIAEKAAEIPGNPKVAMVEWIDPLMMGGNWIPKLVEYASGFNLFTREGEHSPMLNFEDLKEADPDKIIITPCGFDLKHTKEELPSLTEREDWQQLRAVKNKEVYLADGHQYFNRSGPRLLETLEILAEILHPNYFDFNHRKKAWEPIFSN